MIGPSYAEPKVRLPGAGGAPEIAASCREVIVVLRQSTASFVEPGGLHHLGRLQVGPRRTGNGCGLTGAGPRKVITDLGILEPDP